MALISDSITKVLAVLQDPNKTNFQVPELSQYFNTAVGYLSRELAKINAAIGIINDTLVYGVGIFSATLPANFLALATNEKGEERVFNASNSYARVGRSDRSEMDDWESETAADTGVVDSFVIDGLNMIVHPRPKVSTTLKIYYHPLQTIVDDSSTMPWSGWFTDAIEQFVLRQCHLRAEQGSFFQIDQADYSNLATVAKNLLIQRERNPVGFRPRVGWTQ